jgi:hypothetical protein
MRTKFLALATVLGLMGLVAPDTHALIAKNWCGAGSTPPVGKHCPRGDYLLAGMPTANGGCEWRCCAKTSTGKYDCSKDYSAVGHPGGVTPPLSGTNAQVLGRGIEPGLPDDLSAVSSEGAQPIEEPKSKGPKH